MTIHEENATFRDGHHSFVARLMGFDHLIRGEAVEDWGDDPQALALVRMEPPRRSTVGSGMLAADNLVACEQRRAVDAGGVRDAAMATRCPWPWACRAWRLGHLGRRLTDLDDDGRIAVHYVEFCDQYARACVRASWGEPRGAWRVPTKTQLTGNRRRRSSETRTSWLQRSPRPSSSGPYGLLARNDFLAASHLTRALNK
jgi:hypothetical protein